MPQGDRVAAENYLQHAEHYYRILARPRSQQQQQYQQQRGQQPQYNGNGNGRGEWRWRSAILERAVVLAGRRAQDADTDQAGAAE